MKTACDTTDLSVVLGDRNDDPQYEATVEHLSDCSKCQRALEELAADDWWWQQGQQLVQSSVEIEIDISSSPCSKMALAEC